MRFVVPVLIILLLIWLNLSSGSTGWISLADFLAAPDAVGRLQQQILIDVRLAAICTALLSGVALGLAGLNMQVLFQNPLAGPGVMGVSSGGALMVALFMLTGVAGTVALPGVAMLGSVLVLMLILIATRRFATNTTVLILGLMLGYVISSSIQVIELAAEARSLQQFVYWTMGGYGHTTWQDLIIMGPVVLLCTVIQFLWISRSDKLLLGSGHLSLLGFDMSKWRMIYFVLIGVMVGVVTAYCGPLAFIGIAAPHIARLFSPSDRHSIMLPAVIVVSIIISLLSLYLVQAPWIKIQLPLNAVLSVFGAPVVIWLLISKRHLTS